MNAIDFEASVTFVSPGLLLENSLAISTWSFESNEIVKTFWVLIKLPVNDSFFNTNSNLGFSGEISTPTSEEIVQAAI